MKTLDLTNQGRRGGLAPSTFTGFAEPKHKQPKEHKKHKGGLERHGQPMGFLGAFCGTFSFFRNVNRNYFTAEDAEGAPTDPRTGPP